MSENAIEPANDGTGTTGLAPTWSVRLQLGAFVAVSTNREREAYDAVEDHYSTLAAAVDELKAANPELGVRIEETMCIVAMPPPPLPVAPGVKVAFDVSHSINFINDRTYAIEDLGQLQAWVSMVGCRIRTVMGKPGAVVSVTFMPRIVDADMSDDCLVDDAEDELVAAE